MCSSKSNLRGNSSNAATAGGGDICAGSTISHINGRPVLQPNSNRVPLLERRNSLKKPPTTTKSLTNTLQPLSSPSPSLKAKQLTRSLSSPVGGFTSVPPTNNTAGVTPPLSPKLKSPRPPAIKRSGNDPCSGLNSSTDKLLTPRTTAKLATGKKSRNGGDSGGATTTSSSSSSSSSLTVVEVPGSIAAARREQVAIMQVQRKMRIAHYGRSKSAKFVGKIVPLLDSSAATASPNSAAAREEKRCSFITANSDPIYVEYHDQEWGVPAHDDKLLFELLVLTGAQVGSDWTSVLRRRQDFRDAFSEFDAEAVSNYSERKMASMSADYGIELSQVRGVVDNSNCILEIKKEFGSFDKYLWGFVNHKPIVTQYKSCHKIPVKTSKSETISKDMVKRGFRLVGPTVIHSFMQAAGLTNDHLTTCPRHLQCLITSPPTPNNTKK